MTKKDSIEVIMIDNKYSAIVKFCKLNEIPEVDINIFLNIIINFNLIDKVHQSMINKLCIDLNITLVINNNKIIKAF